MQTKFEMFGGTKGTNIDINPEVAISTFYNPSLDTWSWWVRSRTRWVIFAGSNALTEEQAIADAKAAIEMGATEIEPGAANVWVADGEITNGFNPRATLFRRTALNVWVGFHAGMKLNALCKDDWQVPNAVVSEIRRLNEVR